MTRKLPLTSTWLAMGAVGLSLFAAGCGSSEPHQTQVDSSQGKPQSQQSMQQQIQEIQNNPNMPPQAKAAAISAIKRSQSYGAAYGSAQGKAQSQSGDKK